jgi:hypothetical protein
MQLTRFTDYSIRVLTHQSTYLDRPSCIAEIAQAYKISQTHLMKNVVDCPNCLIASACQMTDVFAQATRAFLAVRGNQLHRLFSAATSAGGSARS